MSAPVEHTPLPWEAARLVEHDSDAPLRGEAAALYVAGCVRVGADDADFYAVSQAAIEDAPDICHTGNGPTSAQNAAFIVRACNAHEELLSLLGEAVEMGMPYGPSWFGQITWLERVRTAIEKAGGRT